MMLIWLPWLTKKLQSDWLFLWKDVPPSHAAGLLYYCQVLICCVTLSDFQSPNNDVRYSLIGDSVDEFYFAIDAVSGVITIKRSLADTLNSNVTVFQVMIFFTRIIIYIALAFLSEWKFWQKKHICSSKILYFDEKKYY